jgi:quinol monooxygenase YgiN
VVSRDSRQEFLDAVHRTDRILRAQPGFVRHDVFEQSAGPGRFNFVTVAEWESQSAIDAARSEVTAAHAKSGFNPQETLARLGIEADIGIYRKADTRSAGRGDTDRDVA